MTKHIIAPIVTIVVWATTGAYYYQHADGDTPRVATAAISRGDVVQRVNATGTLEARQTVLVGTQVSGRIVALHADFNSVVRKRQLPALGRSGIPMTTVNLARVWRWVNGVLDPVDIEVGASDGIYAELVGGSLVSGTELVTSVALGGEASEGSAASNGRPPLLATPTGMPPPPPPGAPPPG